MVVNLTQVFTTPAATGLNLSATTTAFLQQHLGKDATYAAHSKPEVSEALRCLVAKYQVAYIGSETTGCMAANVIQTMSLIVILGVVMVRFLMALYFYWCMSPNITKPRRGKTKLRSLPTKSRFSATIREFATPNSLDRERDMYAILLVTCYSEGKDGIRTTLDSLALTDYPDDKKLLFVVADGLITGTGNEKSTPDIIRDMIVEDPELPAPEPKSYVAIADGTKQHNRAKVHAGTYHVEGRSVPIILVAKCGTDAEADSKKPGNRGKRDSQLVVMNFLSRVMFDDRMTPLDYELFYRIQHVAKITAEQYEVVLMVDADTKVARNSLEHMVNAMKNDVSIMGLCGETRIANKTASWTSAMQVFEYYISHHLGKAFESVFGGVTCLPGCFCMYRIKAPKGAHGSWVPVLVNPDIVDEYSENVVDTLHKKNLLLLGEDRFLTTLMLRNFPKRKMIFVPQAVCWTMAPEQFKVLLSQRRRWINSTIHNLMELVLVKDLCGIFCFSMQFVVLLELIGTVVLPAAISFTLYLIISAIATQTVELIPFLLLGAILGLPGFFIIITTRKLVYVGYMFIYLLSLPIWNFVLPAYAFWHFDDFSWGETRKVEGEKKEKTHHGNREGQFESGAVVLKRWAEWERENHPSRPPSEYKFPTPIAVYPRSNRASIVTLPPADHVQPPFAVDPSVVSDASYPPSNVIMPPPPGMYRASVGAFPPPMGPIRFTPNPYMPHGGPFPPFVPQNGELAPMLVAPHTLGVLPGASASQVSNSSLDPLLPDKGKRRGSVSQTTLSSSPSGGNGGSEGGGYRYSHSVGDDESPGEGTTSAVAHPQRNGSGSSSGAGSNSAAGSSGAASTPSTGKGRLVAPDIRIEEVPAVDYR
ncbi:Chitin synthase, class 3 [Borealophlyctis nickersoniae]|nr:Chitin synthase, class 3 [Borealophlyctis nickersoniae]